MKVYHRTVHSEVILRKGFEDSEGTSGADQLFPGVWVAADAPLTNDEVAEGEVVLCIEIPDTLFEQYEWVEEDLECRLYRESFIPTTELNRYPIEIWHQQEARSLPATAPYFWSNRETQSD